MAEDRRIIAVVLPEGYTGACAATSRRVLLYLVEYRWISGQ